MLLRGNEVQKEIGDLSIGENTVHDDKIKRIEPDNEFWPNPEIGAPKAPFKYIITKKNIIIADSYVTHHIKHYDGTVGVYVEPEFRRKGYGKGVVSASMREIFDNQGIVLWSTQIYNKGSLGIAKSLCYQLQYYHIQKPK